MVFAKGYEQSLFPFRDSEGKEKQASERQTDCGSTGALAFKDVGDFRPRSLVIDGMDVNSISNQNQLNPRRRVRNMKTIKEQHVIFSRYFEMGHLFPSQQIWQSFSGNSPTVYTSERKLKCSTTHQFDYRDLDLIWALEKPK